MADTKKKMMEWLGSDGAPMSTPGSLVVAEASGETFAEHSTDSAKHLTAEEKANLTAAAHTHTNTASLEKLVVDSEGLKVDGVAVGGGIAIVATPEEVPVFNGKIRLVVSEYTPPAG